MSRLALTLLLTWVSLCRSVVAWEADKDVRLHWELSERHFNGVEFDAFLKENIFEPVGLERTYVLGKMEDKAIENFAIGYRRNDGGDLVDIVWNDT